MPVSDIYAVYYQYGLQKSIEHTKFID